MNGKCFPFVKKTVLISHFGILCFVDVDECASGTPATATVHVLLVQTLQDPSVVYVTFPSSEMAKLAAKLHPVINNEILGKCPFTRPLFTFVRSTLL